MLMHIFIDYRVAIDEQVQGGVGTGSKEDVGGHSHHVIWRSVKHTEYVGSF